MKKNLFIYLIFPICLCMCGKKTWKDPSSHRISFITVEPDIALELLDWGGKGDHLLFLAGLGNTAHVFDDFAPRFTDKYHVMGLTRRGFGSSAQPETGYDPGTLAKDILKLMDALKLERITLIGHSIAGEEMTKFASLYPSRLNKLIYLDAAYDRTDMMSLLSMEPPFPVMTKKDSASWQHVQNFIQRTYGVRLNESEIREGTIFGDDGHLISDKTPDTVYSALIQSVEHPDYKEVGAPTLAFFVIADSMKDLITFYDQLDSTGRNAAHSFFPAMQNNTRKQIDLFKEQMPTARVIELHRAHHYIFESHPLEVAREIRKFLEGT